MPVISRSFESVEWRRVTDPDCKAFKVDFEYSLLGYDIPSGRLDMLLRYKDGGHCRRHRHVASTVTLVLEGEQFLTEMLPDGTSRAMRRTKLPLQHGCTCFRIARPPINRQFSDR